MEETKSDYDVHVFVCTNSKKGSCCADRGGEELRKELKDWTKSHPEWKGRIRVNSSGCLDRCNDGVAVAIYPQNEWLINAKPSSAVEIKSIIEKLMGE